ncbi:MAG: hypothetical protein HY673_11610 [Chloroflexi bacterium]|nr:hypothetical protein [Chloroflexota bacterium]
MSEPRTKTAGQRGSGMLATIGAIAFYIGFLLAVIGGIFFPAAGWAILILFIIGIIVGLLNITAKEAMPFVVAAIALVVAGTASFAALDKIIPGVGTRLDYMVDYISSMMVPAAIINAIRIVYNLAKPGEQA